MTATKQTYFKRIALLFTLVIAVVVSALTLTFSPSASALIIPPSYTPYDFNIHLSEDELSIKVEFPKVPSEVMPIVTAGDVVCYNGTYNTWAEIPMPTTTSNALKKALSFTRSNIINQNYIVEIPLASFGLILGNEYTFVATGFDLLSPVYSDNTFTCVYRIPSKLPPDPIREGYTFTGWYYDEACTVPYNGEPIYSDTILYDGWAINVYTVIFDSAGGSIVDNISVEHGNVIDLPTPTRTGYTFKGWKLNNKDYSSNAVTDNITLVASWEILVYKVTFMVRGEIYDVVDVKHGQSLVPVAERLNLDIVSLSLGDTLSSFEDGLMVFGNTSVEVVSKATDEVLRNKVVRNWTAIVGGIVGFALLVALIPKKRKRKAY